MKRARACQSLQRRAHMPTNTDTNTIYTHTNPQTHRPKRTRLQTRMCTHASADRHKHTCPSSMHACVSRQIAKDLHIENEGGQIAWWRESAKLMVLERAPMITRGGGQGTLLCHDITDRRDTKRSVRYNSHHAPVRNSTRPVVTTYIPCFAFRRTSFSAPNCHSSYEPLESDSTETLPYATAAPSSDKALATITRETRARAVS